MKKFQFALASVFVVGLLMGFLAGHQLGAGELGVPGALTFGILVGAAIVVAAAWIGIEVADRVGRGEGG